MIELVILLIAIGYAIGFACASIFMVVYFASSGYYNAREEYDKNKKECEK